MNKDGISRFGAGMGPDFEITRVFLSFLLKLEIENRDVQFDDMWDFVDRFFEGKVRDV